MSRPFHGVFSSADAHAPATEPDARIQLFEDGTTTALTIGSTEQCVISSYEATVGTTMTVKLFSGADLTIADGELLDIAKLPVGKVAGNVTRRCIVGTYPKIKTDLAGQIDVIARGWIE